MNKINMVALVVVIFVLGAPTAHAYPDGNSLLENCRAAEVFLDTGKTNVNSGAGYCFGLIQGVRNTMQILGNESRFKACFPENKITNAQATRIVTTYLKNNPEHLHEGAEELIIIAYIRAFPCT